MMTNAAAGGEGVSNMTIVFWDKKKKKKGKISLVLQDRAEPRACIGQNCPSRFDLAALT
jgi:hypothetical protein